MFFQSFFMDIAQTPQKIHVSKARNEVMNPPAPPLIEPDSVSERLVDIMNNVFTLVVHLGENEDHYDISNNNLFIQWLNFKLFSWLGSRARASSVCFRTYQRRARANPTKKNV